MLLLLLLSLLAAASVSACGYPEGGLQRKDFGKTAITNVHVWTERGFTRFPTTVVFINGRIAMATPIGATIVDGKGGYLVPGFIDSHCHVTSCSYLEQMRQYGVTTALDMGSFPVATVHGCRASGGTDIYTPGAVGTVNGTLISEIPGLPADSLIPNPAAGRQFVANRVSQGADYIKVFLDPLGPDEETVAAIVAAAHEAGKLVITHTASYDAFALAEAAKPDIPCHVPLDRVLDPASVAKLAANKQTGVPTLIMMQSITNNTHLPYSVYTQNAQGSATNMHKAGIPILVGTDANAIPLIPANPPFGVSLHQELQLLVQAGLSPVEAINGATSAAASRFRLYDRGSILPGLRADLVLLSADPTKDIRNSLSIEKVWLNGVEFDPEN